ncbi:MAG: sulfite exporter TauE/SafE family protein [Nitrospinae bacterium]|nr:sulfite exporter TauE/SafE family protein [Nitrospinota bacterium]
MTIFDNWGLFGDNWFMSVTMVFGSFIAGSTSVGGGAVAFPVMTLMYDIPPPVARDFSLMVQSVGMTAATLTIIFLRIPVEWRVITFISIGGFLGIVFGLEEVAPRLPSSFAMLFFTSLWFAFGLIIYWVNRHSDRFIYTKLEKFTSADIVRLFVIGFIGGTVSGVTGTGIDIVAFSLLSLYFRLCEKIATPTSVVLMTINSLAGFLWKESFSVGMEPAAWNYWWVCVPVVVIGAPLGAWFIKNKSRFFIIGLLCSAIIVQYIGALFILPMDAFMAFFSLAIIVLGVCCFWGAEHFGKNRFIVTPKEEKI